jgi:hypothetical protein
VGQRVGLIFRSNFSLFTFILFLIDFLAICFELQHSIVAALEHFYALCPLLSLMLWTAKTRRQITIDLKSLPAVRQVKLEWGFLRTNHRKAGILVGCKARKCVGLLSGRIIFYLFERRF